VPVCAHQLSSCSWAPPRRARLHLLHTLPVCTLYAQGSDPAEPSPLWAAQSQLKQPLSPPAEKASAPSAPPWPFAGLSPVRPRLSCTGSQTGPSPWPCPSGAEGMDPLPHLLPGSRWPALPRGHLDGPRAAWPSGSRSRGAGCEFVGCFAPARHERATAAAAAGARPGQSPRAQRRGCCRDPPGGAGVLAAHPSLGCA